MHNLTMTGETLQARLRKSRFLMSSSSFKKSVLCRLCREQNGLPKFSTMKHEFRSEMHGFHMRYKRRWLSESRCREFVRARAKAVITRIERRDRGMVTSAKMEHRSCLLSAMSSKFGYRREGTNSSRSGSRAKSTTNLDIRMSSMSMKAPCDSKKEHSG